MAYCNAPLKVITQNCRGLNIPERRTHLLRELKKKHVAIAMLQETHFKEGSTPRLRDRHYPDNYFCNHPTAHKSGVAILLAAELEFKELDRVQDSQGRYLFLKGIIADKIYTIATIYVPNRRQAPPRTWTWRLNEALLLDPGTKDQIRQALDQYFGEKDTPEASPISVWEAHKSVLRGTLIRIASQKRKAFMLEMVDLYRSISTLERQHKRSQLNAVYGELMEHRRRLKDLILKRHLRSVQRSKGFYYVHANKGGKYLARLLKGPLSHRQIRKIRLATGEVSPFPQKIAGEFRSFYEHLYNLYTPN
ncbi:endonuclease [Pelobates cultripes]|uniref:exodeoxyribonuclease III n=1 Tax=Pelobates cultripes TaxID=61616 RepID=A0AAD1VZV2_PELCU|nr:endonuclease [Pelobates cultripes]